MSEFNQPKLMRYTATNGKKISRSTQHHDLWTVTMPDGMGWYALTANADTMQMRNPVDPRLEVSYL